MDDPISALDARVRRAVFMNTIMGHLKNKTRILVTHSIDFIHLADKIIIMDNGRIAEQGSFEQIKNNAQLKKLLKINNLNKMKTEAKEKADFAKLEKMEKLTSYDSSSEANVETDNCSEASFCRAMDNDGNSIESEDDKIAKFEKLGDKEAQKKTKLMDKEDDEGVDILPSTYSRWTMLQGGVMMILLKQSFMVILRCVDLKNDFTLNSWAVDTDQQDNKAAYSKMILGLALGRTCINVVQQLFDFRQKTKMVNSIHDPMLERVMNAPVNLFYDVMKIDKVNKRFTSDINTFEHNFVGEFMNTVY